MRHRPILILALAIAQIAFYTQLIGFLQTNIIVTDFVSFYTGGRLLQAGRPLYDLAAQRSIQEPIFGPGFIAGGHNLFNHAPFIAPLAALAAGDDYGASFLRWELLMLPFTLGAAWVIYALLRAHGWHRANALIGALGGLLFYPLFVSHLAGQDTPLVLAAALTGLYGLSVRRERLGGIAFALLLVKPQLGLMFGAPLLSSGRRAGLWFVAAGAALALFSLALVGWSGALDYIGILLVAARGEGYGLNQTAMYNFTGALLRLAPGLPVAALRGLSWGCFILTLAGLCISWRRSGGVISPGRMGVTVVALLFASPHLHFHDLSLLLIPCLAVSLLAAERGGRWAAVAPELPALTSLLLLAANVGPEAVRYWVVYALMAALAGGIWALGRPSAQLAPAVAPAATIQP